MEQIFTNIMTKNIYISIIIIIIIDVIYFVSKKIIEKLINKNSSNARLNKKKKTYLKLFRNILNIYLLL